jgi:high-affinity nickel permease
MDVSHTGFGVALVVSAFAFGFRHGIDWDHIAAITDITSSQRSVRTGLRYATLYAAGHGVVVFAIGVAAIVAGVNVSPAFDALMGRVVGVTLVVLGVYVIYALIRYREDFRLRSRWMLMFSGVRKSYRWLRERLGPDDTIAHDHDHSSSGVQTKTHTHTHADPFVDYGTGTSLAVGALHGVGAETPTQVLIFLAAAGAGGIGAGILTLLVFLIGLFAANSLLALASASGYLAADRHFAVYATISVFTGVASFVLGVLFLAGKDAWLPAFFGG